MRRTVLMLLTLAACGEGPDDLVRLDLVTSDERGQPLGGVPIDLHRNVVSGALTECRSERAVRSIVTDGGAGTFDLVRAETEALVPGNRSSVCLGALAHFPSGTEANVDVSYFTNRARIDGLLDWRPAPHLDADGGLRFAPFEPLDSPCPLQQPYDPGDGGAERVRGRHTVELRRGGDVWWQQAERRTTYFDADGGYRLEPESLDTPLGVDPQLVEDATVEVVLRARAVACTHYRSGDLVGSPSVIGTELLYSVPRQLEASGALVPVSRGARCAGYQPSCPFTDGLGAPVSMKSEKSLRLSLATPARVSTLVLRRLLALNLPFDPQRPDVEPQGPPSRATLRALDADGRVIDQREIIVDRVASEDTGYSRGSFAPTWARAQFDTPLGAASEFELELDVKIDTLAEVSLFE